MNIRWNCKQGLNYDILKYSKRYIDILKTAKCLVLAKNLCYISYLYIYLSICLFICLSIYILQVKMLNLKPINCN